MRLYVQWALKEPKDWVAIDSTQWSNLPKGNTPTSETELPESEKLYINQINIQGVAFRTYDHYAIHDDRTGCVKITCWNDDLEDHDGDFYAVVWTFCNPRYDPIVGCVNTVQSWITFVQSKERRKNIESYNIANLKYLGSWEEFEEPEPELTRHGIWMPDDLFEHSLEVVTPHGWYEWVLSTT